MLAWHAHRTGNGCPLVNMVVPQTNRGRVYVFFAEPEPRRIVTNESTLVLTSDPSDATLQVG
jgi:hypothetical protein